MEDLRFSILMPAYNGADIISETIKSILSQSFSNFEMIIQDDGSKDNTEGVVRSFNDKRIIFYQNKNNLGYPGNLDDLRKKAAGDIIYLMGQDDILGKDALLDTYNAFKLSNEIGAVTRPYFWFNQDVKRPVRVKQQLNASKDEIVRIQDDFEKILAVFKTIDQLSGLAFRRKYMDLPFHQDVFTSHIYPFASIFKKHPVVFLKDYNIGVRIANSQSRNKSSIYNKSPIQSWVDMFNNVFFENEFRQLKNKFIKDFVSKNYIGLVQIRNYAKYRYLLREIECLIKYRWQNVFNPIFWFFSLGCLIIPPSLLIPFVDWYKEKVNSRRLRKVVFKP